MTFIGGSLFSQINDFTVLFDTGTNAIINNPANLVNSSDLEISIAPFANSQLDITFPFSTSIIFLKRNDIKNIVDLPTLFKKAKKNNSAFFSSTITLVYLSSHWKKLNWNFYISDKINSSLGFQYSLFEFLNTGNKAFIGENIEFSIPINEIHYRNYSISLAKAVSNRFTFGISGNLYFGKSMIKLLPNFLFFTHENLDYIEFSLSGKGSASIPVDYVDNEKGNVVGFNSTYYFRNYLFRSDNPGLGVDIGVSYKLNNQVSLSASATDIGFIYWNNSIKNLTINGTYNWNGVDLSDIVDIDNNSSFIENITTIDFQDSFINRLIVYNEKNIFSFIPINLNFSVAYNYTDKIMLAFQNNLQFDTPFVREAFSVSGSYLLHENWTLMAGLSFKNRSCFNVPAGIAFKNNRFKTTFNLINLWSVFIPSLGTRFGGGFNITYIFKHRNHQKYEQDIHYPFYKRLDNKVEGKVFY